MTSPLVEEIRRTLRAPYTPAVIESLAQADGYLEHTWPALRASIETAGFWGSAMYMADMALDAVEEVYEPVMSAHDVRTRGMQASDLDGLTATLDVFHYVQPQVLLLCAALAEAFDRPRVGGQGRVEPRELTEREERHLATDIPFASPDAGLLPEISEALGVEPPPDLYRAVASWPAYLAVAWEELQHLVAYPQFRRRGRGLYYYARSGSRFLAQPLEADGEALRAAGLTEEAIERARRALDASPPVLATMMMHCEAMRLGLGVGTREVVQD